MSGFNLERIIEAPLEKVWAAADFTKSTDPFPMEMVNEGDPAMHGKGFVRAVTAGKRKVLERLESVDPMRSYTYTMVDGVPVKPGYLGKVEFTPKGNATKITCSISFVPKFPGTGWFISLMIKRIVSQIIDMIDTKSRQAV